MTADRYSIVLIFGSIIQQFVAEQRYIQFLIKEFLCYLEIDIHGKRYSVFEIIAVVIISDQIPEISIISSPASTHASHRHYPYSW